jgi:small subunit ribosomal protein S21
MIYPGYTLTLMEKNKNMDYRNDSFSQGSKVIVHNNDISRAMRKLKKKLLEDGIMQDLRDREFFQTKGTKKRIAKMAAIRRYKKLQTKKEE